MIDSHELRAGNYVTTSPESPLNMPSGIPVVVFTIGFAECKFLNDLTLPWSQQAPFRIDYRHVHPIPITREWLEKLGFDMDDDIDEGVIRFLKVIDGITLRWNGFLEMEVTTQYVTIRFDLDHIKYVHQLQNLYFALTGQELTLK